MAVRAVTVCLVVLMGAGVGAYLAYLARSVYLALTGVGARQAQNRNIFCDKLVTKDQKITDCRNMRSCGSNMIAEGLDGRLALSVARGRALERAVQRAGAVGQLRHQLPLGAVSHISAAAAVRQVLCVVVAVHRRRLATSMSPVGPRSSVRTSSAKSCGAMMRCALSR